MVPEERGCPLGIVIDPTQPNTLLPVSGEPRGVAGEHLPAREVQFRSRKRLPTETTEKGTLEAASRHGVDLLKSDMSPIKNSD